MWNTPLILRTVSTWNHVLEKLQSGADLMTPGLTSWDPEIKTGDVTAIRLENRVPVAVGIAAFDVGHLTQSRRGKGKAIYLVHCHHDELWALGSKINPPSQPPNDPQVDPLKLSTHQLSLDERKGAVDTEETSQQPVGEPQNEPEEKQIREPSASGSSPLRPT